MNKNKRKKKYLYKFSFFLFYLLVNKWKKSYLPRILETQPWLTRNCLDMSQGLTPWWANSTILCLTTSGSGRPLTKTPPNWFTPPWPVGERNNVTFFKAHMVERVWKKSASKVFFSNKFNDKGRYALIKEQGIHIIVLFYSL